ncbi:DICT sensory domain-containing protein [Halobacteriaceae archaeon SHR40]|uniref:DICT sensory domain-containing protein n=1 Tax=Halovenus amylolytica TaxID=2500550 RepID=UPI000FE2DE32
MDLSRAIEYIQHHRKDLTLFNLADPSVAGELASLFRTQNLRIRTARTASGRPREVAVLSSASRVLAVVDVAELRELVSTVPTARDVGIADSEYADVLQHLKETTFTSYDKAQLFYASREVEDRARRVGCGTIHAGFQRVSVMADQQRIYRDLARQGVEVHAYGLADAGLPDFGPGEIHTTDAEEIEQMWFVVFDGGGEPAQKTALIAEQRDDGWFGAWTYDAVLVDDLCTHLETTYLTSTDDQRLSGQ